jgi:hypothetical protein
VTFLWPAGLLGLLAVPLLVLLYLFRSRHQPRRVPSLILWRHVPRDEATATTLRRPRWEWLLLWQVLLATALSLMLARPVVDLPGQRHVGLVMDVSASMAARDVTPSRFDAARQSALDLARGAGPRDRFSLVSAGRQPTVLLLGGSASALEASLAALQIEDGMPDLATAIGLAASQSGPAAGGVSEIVVFTDRSAELSAAPRGTPVSFHVVSADGERLAIPFASVRRTPDGGGRLAGFASVVNPGQQERHGTLTVTNGTNVLSRIGLDLPANGRQDVTFFGPSSATTLTVALADEEPWPGGNRLQLPAPARFARSMLIVSDEAELWERALAVVPDVTTRTLTTAEYQAPPDDAIVLFDRFLPAQLPELPLILIDPPNRPDLLERPAGGARPRTAVDLDVDDPLLRGIDLAPLTVSAQPAGLPRWAAAPAVAADGPLVLYGVWQARPIVALTFDPQDSNLPQLEAFPLLLNNAVDWLTPGRTDVLAAGLGAGAFGSTDATAAVQAAAQSSGPRPPTLELWPLFGLLALAAWIAEWLVTWGGTRRWLRQVRER